MMMTILTQRDITYVDLTLTLREIHHRLTIFRLCAGNLWPMTD